MSLMPFILGAAAAAREFLIGSAKSGDPEQMAEAIFRRARRLLDDQKYLRELCRLEAGHAQAVIGAVLAGTVAHGSFELPTWQPPAIDAPDPTTWRDAAGQLGS